MFGFGFLFLAVWVCVYFAAMLFDGRLVPFGGVWRTLFITGVLSMILSGFISVAVSVVAMLVVFVGFIVVVMFLAYLVFKVWRNLFGNRSRSGQ